jgi:hypothetical protein
MSNLQKVNLGTPPSAVDGDTVRTANEKANANVDVLNAQAALTSAADIITVPQALTNEHIGRRVNISLAAPGTINMPAASTCAVDNVILLRNVGATVVTLAIAMASGDTVGLSKLNPGESALMDADGAHAWTALMRGRTNSDNEVVNGNCAVAGNETVGGSLGVGTTLSVTGASTLTGDVAAGGKLSVADTATFAKRPTFNTHTPYDDGNLITPLTAADNLNSVANKATARTNLGVGKTLIQTLDLTNVPQLAFTGLTGYESYEIVIHHANAVTDGSNLHLQLSTNNGADSFSPGSVFSDAITFVEMSTFVTINSGEAVVGTGWRLFTVMAAGLGRSYSGVVNLYNLGSALVKNANWRLSGYASNSMAYMVQGGGVASIASSVNAVRLVTNVGNITAKASIYGINS